MEQMITDCTAIVMAGGDSQRMGRDKANVMLGDKTLLQSVIATMRQLFPQVIVSVRQPRAGIDLPQVCDEQPDGGPLAGLVASLRQITTPWAFMMACDMPFVVPEVVELLAGYRLRHQAVVPVVHGHPQPLAAFYAASCLVPLHASLAAQQKSLRGALQQLEVRYVDEAEMLAVDPQLRSFFDLDTPQDVEAARNGVK
ncbi:MAG: molybdenum cofactor guanylyltransferase [Gallionellaceae bacterium]|nr:molybdenum cofactor guanylyltransferase [Gallionellaceae bacterium]